jgi:Flp pilus assembly pilin Flp
MLTRLAGDEHGASLIEMALLLPILASLIVGIVDVSRAFSAKLDLQQAAERTIEKVQQYQTEGGFDTLRAEAAAAAGVPPSSVKVDYWLECNGLRQADFETNCPEGQEPARWVKVIITGTYTPMFASSRWPGSNKDGTYTIHGDAGLRAQ